MQDWLPVIVSNVVTIIQVMALLVVAFGTLQAFVHSLRAMFSRSSAGGDFQSGYRQYARWLIAGLTFQLAADIIHTSFAPSWDEIGQLAAISAIRAFVNFFLEHDLAQHEKTRLRSPAVSADRATDPNALTDRST